MCLLFIVFFFFFKQKTAYEMAQCDWSSDVCSSDLDARTPLLVADDLGVRLRLGRSWAGLTWGSLRRVQVTGRAGLRDGRVVLVPRNAERVEAEADAGARRSLRLARRLYGDPFTVPLSLATRVVGTDDIEAALRG